MKILFVCTGNVMRSKTAHALLEQRGGYEVRSAGTHAEWVGRGGTQLTKEHVEWADRIVVFESAHVSFIRSQFGRTVGRTARRKLVNLDVPDMFAAFDPRLIEILTKHFDRLFQGDGMRDEIHT